MIYALNVRHFSNNSMEIVPSLLRRASWQRRTGYILDERATYRRVIRIIEATNGKGWFQLESGHPDLAARTFGRAVHISHVNEGPHNLEQIGILESLAETNLRLGDSEEAKNNHDMIYALNVRHFSNNSMEIVPSLLRRASWQRRTGYILDERATYRRVIRIIEATNGKGDIALIHPLLRLGESYFFIDTSDSVEFYTSTAASGEMYFKRAARIAEENPESNWKTLAKAILALGDYYNFRSNLGRARKTYREAWELMSAEEDRLETRKQTLEVLTTLNENPISRFAGNASDGDLQPDDSDLREGRIMVSFDVNARGRVTGLKVIEANPIEFESMRRLGLPRKTRNQIGRHWRKPYWRLATTTTSAPTWGAPARLTAKPGN